MALPIVALCVLTACDPYPPTLHPDYRVVVAPTPNGSVAVPPTCANWVTQNVDLLDDQPMPQFGCANARNLAMSVERPDDLLQGRKMGPSSGVTSVGSILRYNANQTRGLIDPTSAADSAVATTTASTSASAISGEAAGGGGGAASSSAGAATPAAATATAP